MPEIDLLAPTAAAIIAFQKQMALSDDNLARAIGWKPGAGEPTQASILAFKYLRALWDITVLNPTHGEEIYSIAFSALPRALQ